MDRHCNCAQITGMGLIIYDNQDGPFELHMASVHAYSKVKDTRSTEPEAGQP